MTRASLWSRTRAILRRGEVEAELREELEFHLQMQARKYQAAGLSEVDAIARARLEFGNLELVKEDARDVRGVRPLEDFIADVRYGLRGLLRAPVFSLSVILTIGLGVGVNTSVFTIFNAYVLRPFDIQDPYSLYSLQWLDRSGRVRDFLPTDVAGWRLPASVVSDVATYRTFGARLGRAPATGDAVSGNYFRMTGVRAAIGRTLLSGDRYLPVVVLGYALWRDRFGADSASVGKTITIRGATFRVVGVAQQGFEGFFKKPRDFWIPIDAQPPIDAASSVEGSAGLSVSLLVRLAPGVSASQGKAFFASTLQSMTADLPDSLRATRVFLTSRATAIAPSAGAFLAFLPLVLAFASILALACANVANMLLARGIARQRELGIRLALGAGRPRLVRQLVTEAVVLALPAVALGFTIAALVVDFGVRALFATLPADLSAFVRLVPLDLDLRVLAFALGASLGAAILFGIMPALRVTRLSLVDAIRGNFEGTPRRRPGVRLVFGQIVVASLLLTTAGVLVREAGRLGRINTGLRTGDVASVELQEKSRSAVLRALRGSAHVDTIAAAATLPLDMRFPTAAVQNADSSRMTVLYNRVSAAYFNVLNIPIIAGRGFVAQEEANGAAVVIASEAAARRLWPGESPLGRLVRFAVRNRADPIALYQNATVVGVTRDVVVNSVEDGSDPPVLYVPQSLESVGCCLLVRLRGEAFGAKRALDQELENAAPGAVDRIDLLGTFVAGAVYPYRVAYWVALALGAIALGLTVIGVYGVVAYTVNQRVREIGVRIALGAGTINVLRLIIGQSLRHAAVGAAAGSVLALGSARVLAANVQSMPAFDAVAFVSAFGTVVLSCVVAAFIASHRAATVDPTVALRHE